jgi:hypothetical protein
MCDENHLALGAECRLGPNTPQWQLQNYPT